MLKIYPVTLTYRTQETVREPQWIWDWNLDPPAEVANGYHVRTVMGRRERTIEVPAAGPAEAWKALASLPELKGVPLAGSDLISVQVGAPLNTTMQAWIKRQRRDPVIWRS